MKFFKNKSKPDEVQQSFLGKAILFKLNDGSWAYPTNLVGSFNSDRERIESGSKMYKDKLLGTYDLYKFKLKNGEIVELITRFSYEEIWKLWREHGGSVNKDGFVAWGLKFKNNDEEFNKQVMIMSILLEINRDNTFGSGNSELDKNLNRDHVLVSLARSGGINGRNKKDTIKAIKEQISHYKLPDDEMATFQTLIDAIESYR